MDYLAAAEAALAIGGAVVTTASAICALTPTPDPASPLGKVYRIVEILGLVVGRAKQLGVMPDNAAADRIGARVVDVAKKALGTPAVALALCAGLGLTLVDCGGGVLPALSKQPADPKVVGEIKTACLGSGLFKLAGDGLSIAVPVAGIPVSVINAGVDKVCADPAAFAADISTAEWVVKNTIAAIGKTSG